jgi:hypothetical protein
LIIAETLLKSVNATVLISSALTLSTNGLTRTTLSTSEYSL